MMNEYAQSDPIDQPRRPEGTVASPRDVYPAGSAYPAYGSYAASSMIHQDGPMAGLTPARIARALLRKWWLVLLAVGFGLSLAALYLHRTEPRYRAEAVAEMSIRRPRILAQPGVMIDDGFAGWRVDELLNTRIRKLQGAGTRDLARERLLEQSDIRLPPPERVHAALGTARLNRQRDTHLVSITAEDLDPAFAAFVANAFAEAVVMRSIQENRIESDQAVAWLEQQAAHQAVVLEQAEEALLTFRADEQMDQLHNEKRILEESVVSLSQELTRIEKHRVTASELLAMLDAVNAQPEQFGNLPDTIPYHREMLNAVSQWTEAVGHLNQLATRMTDRHPQFIEQQRQADHRRDRVTSVIQRARETTEANIRLYEQQARTLRNRIDAQSESATRIESRLAQLRTRLSALERTRDSADASFKGLLTRIEEARLAADENTSVIHIIENARPPGSPVYPRRNRALMLGLFGGGVLGVALALGLYVIEDGIEGTEPIEREVGLKVIGLIPHEDIHEVASLAKIALSKEYHPMVEAFAHLRAMLESKTYRADSTSILITSTAPEEGKTTVASNLAISLARAGHRTCLIGFDLRQPKLRPIFHIPGAHPSLTMALQEEGRTDYGALPFQVSTIPLWVISARHGRESYASEVLGSPAVSALIEWATRTYDRVIIDSPPYSLIGDSLVLAGRVSGVLLVCRPSVTRMRALRHVARDFSEAGANMLGVLVNDIEFRRASYFSNYHYYDNHAYRYSHSYDQYAGGEDPGLPGNEQKEEPVETTR